MKFFAILILGLCKSTTWSLNASSPNFHQTCSTTSAPNGQFHNPEQLRLVLHRLLRRRATLKKKQASGSSETLCRTTTPLIPNAAERKTDVTFESLTLTGFINFPEFGSEWTPAGFSKHSIKTVVAQPLIPGTETTWKPNSDISYAGICGKRPAYGEWDSEAENSTDVRSEGNFSSPHLARVPLWMRERTPSDAWEIHPAPQPAIKLFYMCIWVRMCWVSSHEPTAIITARRTDWREAKSDQAEMNVSWHALFIFPTGFTTAPAWLKPLCDAAIWRALQWISAVNDTMQMHHLCQRRNLFSYSVLKWCCVEFGKNSVLFCPSL